MVKKLREYWELERRAASSRVAALRATEARESGQRVAEPESRSAADVLRFGQTTFAQRLHAFVAGGGEPGGYAARAPWREAAESAPALALRTISEPKAGMVLSSDFAEQLTDTLRSQATQHGIDLT